MKVLTSGKGKIMKRQQWGVYAIALAVLLVGLIALGVPASTLLIGAFLLACPLMMLFMHSGSDHGSHDQHADRPAASPEVHDHHDHDHHDHQDHHDHHDHHEATGWR